MTDAVVGVVTIVEDNASYAKKTHLISVLLISLTVSCKSRSSKIPKPPSGDKTVSELQITSQSEAFIEETQLLSLSPDGKWFFRSEAGVNLYFRRCNPG